MQGDIAFRGWLPGGVLAWGCPCHEERTWGRKSIEHGLVTVRSGWKALPCHSGIAYRAMAVQKPFLSPESFWVVLLGHSSSHS